MPLMYTDAATVAAALGFNAQATLSNQINAGTNSLPIDTVPVTWQVGMFLALDYYNPATREVVQITGPAVGASVPITATVNGHANGTPVADCSGLYDWIGAATAAVDDFCFMRRSGAFAQQTVTETVKSNIDNDGWLIIPCSLPEPQTGSITALSYQPSPADPVYDLSTPLQVWAENRYCLKVGNLPAYPGLSREVMATITYTGGYNPVPDDIQRAAVALAARFYKEKDSGFSDTIGTSDMGSFTYKKAIPSDVKMMLRPHIRYA